ncbi:MAG: 4Fe-4S ferredoxin, partial [Candidatus Limivicinus sp.]|nr:4Fe-4S ferredoxin [Candidatus Limivicinus sp.]
MKRIKGPLTLWLIFETIAVSLWLSLDNVFYLLNFSYIGTCLAVGIGLFDAHCKYARHAVQLAV